MRRVALNGTVKSIGCDGFHTIQANIAFQNSVIGKVRMNGADISQIQYRIAGIGIAGICAVHLKGYKHTVVCTIAFVGAVQV